MKGIKSKDLVIKRLYKDIIGTDNAINPTVAPTIFKVIAKIENTQELVMKYISGDTSYNASAEEDGKYKGYLIFSLDSDQVWYEADKILQIESQTINSPEEARWLELCLQLAKEAGYTHVYDNWGHKAYDEYTIDEAIAKFKSNTGAFPNEPTEADCWDGDDSHTE